MAVTTAKKTAAEAAEAQITDKPVNPRRSLLRDDRNKTRGLKRVTRKDGKTVWKYTKPVEEESVE